MADFDSLTELLDSLSKGLDTELQKATTPQTTPTKYGSGGTFSKAKTPVNIEISTDELDDIPIKPVFNNPKQSKSSGEVSLNGSIRLREEERKRLEKQQQLEDELQREEQLLKDKMRKLEEQKKNFAQKKQEEEERLRKLEMDYQLEADILESLDPSARNTALSNPEPKPMKDKMLSETYMQSFLPKRTNQPRTYTANTNNEFNELMNSINSGSSSIDNIPDYDDFIKIHSPSLSQTSSPVVPPLTRLPEKRFMHINSIENMPDFEDFMDSSSQHPVPNKATTPKTSRETIPDYDSFIASQQASTTTSSRNSLEEEDKRISRYAQPLVQNARGVSTRNLDDLSKIYRDKKIKGNDAGTLDRKSLVPLEKYSSTTSSMRSKMTTPGSSFHGSPNESEDEQSNVDTDSDDDNKQSALDDVLETLGSLEPYEGRDDKFTENQEMISLERIPPRPMRQQPIPNSIHLLEEQQRDKQRRISVASVTEVEKYGMYNTVAHHKPTNKFSILATDLGTALATELRNQEGSANNSLRDQRKFNVDTIVNNRSKKETLRTAKNMIDREARLLYKENTLRRGSNDFHTLSRVKSQANIFHGPSQSDNDTMRKARIARKLAPDLPQIYLTINLIDDTSKKIIVTEDFTVQDVIYAFAEKLGLWQIDYFAISEKQKDGKDRWLSPGLTLEEEEVNSNSVLMFKVKFWKTPKKLIDPTAIHLYYLQLYQYIKTEYFKVPSGMALKLAAFVMQIVYGDYDKSKHKVGYFDEALMKVFLPESARMGLPVEYLEQQIFRIHSTLKGSLKTDIKLKYIAEVKKLTLFGVTLFKVIEEGIERVLGVAEDGILISIKNSNETFDFYPYIEIDGFQHSKFGVDIKINNPDKKPLFSFGTVEGGEIVELMSGYYTILRYQVYGKDNVWPIDIPHYPHAMPDHHLFHLPNVRIVNDPNTSRGELLKYIYVSEVQKAKKNYVFGFLKLLDNHLTADTSPENIVDSLALNGSGMDTSQLEVIAESLSKTFKYSIPRTGLQFHENVSIKTINVSYNLLIPEASLAIGTIMSCPIPIKTIDLTEIRLGVKGSKLLVNYLETCNTLEQLIMPYNDLTNKGLIPILSAIKNNKNISALDFSWNNLDDKIASNLVDILPGKPALKQLSLAGNKLGDSTVKGIIAALRKSGTKTVTHLDVGVTHISSATKLVVEWLYDNHQVEKLYLSKSKMTDKVSFQLAKNVAESRLTVLDIKMCNVASKSLLELCNHLNNNRKLQELHLSGNKIDKKVGTSLYENLSTNSTLHTLSLRNCSLQKSTIIGLLSMLKKDKTIRVIDLALNVDINSSNDIATELEEMLIQNKSIEDLNLSACKLSSKTLLHFIPGLSRNTSIKVLRLDANKLGKEITKIATAIKQPGNNKIEEITMRKCEINTKHLQKFFAELGPNAQLKRIALEKNEVDKNKFKDLSKDYPFLVIKF